MTEAIKAYGTKLKRDEQEIALVNSIEGPAMEREELDVTAHDSPDGFREFIPGIADGGEVTLEVRFVPGNSTHQDVLKDFEQGNTENYELEFPDETTWSFDAFPTSFEPSAEFEENLQASITLKVTGKPELNLPEE